MKSAARMAVALLLGCSSGTSGNDAGTDASPGDSSADVASNDAASDAGTCAPPKDGVRRRSRSVGRRHLHHVLRVQVEHAPVRHHVCLAAARQTPDRIAAVPYVACNSDTSNLDGGVLSTLLTGLDQAASTIVAKDGWLYFTQVIENGPVYRLWVDIAFGDGGATRPDGDRRRRDDDDRELAAGTGRDSHDERHGLSAPGLIMSSPTNGGSVAPLASGLNDPAALAFSGSTLYWTIANSSPDKGAVMALTPF